MDMTTLKEACEDHKWHDAIRYYRTLDEASPEAHLYGGSAYRMLGQLMIARRCLEVGLSGKSDSRTRLKLTLLLGVVCREIGDWSTAIDWLTKFVDDVQVDRSLAAVSFGAAYHNLGLAYRQMRRFDKSIASYQHACDYHRAEHMPHMLMQSLHNLAWAYCVAGNPTAAGDILDEAETLCKTTSDHAHQMVGRAFAAITRGDIPTASLLCTKLFEMNNTPDEVLSHSYMLAGRIALSQGDLTFAHTLATTSLHHAESVKDYDSRCLHDAADLLRDINGGRVNHEAPDSGFDSGPAVAGSSGDR